MKKKKSFTDLHISPSETRSEEGKAESTRGTFSSFPGAIPFDVMGGEGEVKVRVRAHIGPILRHKIFKARIHITDAEYYVSVINLDSIFYLLCLKPCYCPITSSSSNLCVASRQITLLITTVNLRSFANRKWRTATSNAGRLAFIGPQENRRDRDSWLALCRSPGLALTSKGMAVGRSSDWNLNLGKWTDHNRANKVG